LSGVEFFAALGTGPQALMFLDGVSNPHNVGAITRSMAHFGSRFLLGAAGELPPMSASWARISEGGSEMVDIHRSEDKSALLASLTQKGYTSYALSSKGSKSLYEVDLPERSIFLLGHEIHGLAPSVVNSASVSIRIPGSGKMGSLNVSTAAALCLSEWYRRRLLSAPRKG
jgi:TrmH RNA methyltransferase